MVAQGEGQLILIAQAFLDQCHHHDRHLSPGSKILVAQESADLLHEVIGTEHNSLNSAPYKKVVQLQRCRIFIMGHSIL